jgi:hypothetical protein
VATITPAPSARPLLHAPNEKHVFTATVDNADDLVVPRHPDVTLLVTAASVASDVNTIGDGYFAGQLCRLVVVNATNVLGLVIALTNVNNTADVDVSRDAPATLMWDGTNWQVIAR